jgi:hypothetical protein
MSSSIPSYSFEPFINREISELQRNQIYKPVPLYQEFHLDRSFMAIDTDYKTIGLREIKTIPDSLDVCLAIRFVNRILNPITDEKFECYASNRPKDDIEAIASAFTYFLQRKLRITSLIMDLDLYINIIISIQKIIFNTLGNWKFSFEMIEDEL